MLTVALTQRQEEMVTMIAVSFPGHTMAQTPLERVVQVSTELRLRPQTVVAAIAKHGDRFRGLLWV